MNKSNINNSLKILLYHGVSSEKSVGIENSSGKHIGTDIFKKQMAYLSTNCNVISMDEVVFNYRNKLSYPENAVAITFDDGFRNNVTEAMPILEKFNIPATFYVSAGVINTDIMFWVDMIEDCLNNSQRSVITIGLDNEKTFDLKSQSKKINVLQEIKSYCKNAKSIEKDRVIKNLIQETQWTPMVHSSKNYEKMSWEELRFLASKKLFTIGGHSLYHDILSSFDDDKRLESDIKLSIDLLKYNLKMPIVHYAYPEGQANHFNSKIISLLNKYGIVCSPSAINGINDETYDLFNLRRTMVGINGGKFPFKLS